MDVFAVERLFFAVDRATAKNHQIMPQTSGVQKWSGNRRKKVEKAGAYKKGK